MRRLHISTAGLLALLVQACGNVETTPPGTSSTSTTSTSSSTTGSGGGDVDVCADKSDPPPAPQALCQRVSAGPGGLHSIPVDLSAAHAGVRFFAPIETFADADQTLAAALEAPTALTNPDLAPFAALPGVGCALPASSDGPLGPASVEMIGDIALVHPGTGTVKLPPGTAAVVVDLRGLSEQPDLPKALEAAVSPALAAPVEGTAFRVRRHEGLEDEIFSATNTYKNDAHVRIEPVIPAGSATPLPLAVLTGAVMAPSAARLAGSLRVARAAWILGEGVRSEVAEMTWQGVGTTGLAYRVGEMFRKIGSGPASRWPDEIPADFRSLHPECLIATLPSLGMPPAIEGGPSDRSAIKAVHEFHAVQPASQTLGTARAALIAAHGAVRLFFPYFGTVGDIIDDRLLETLESFGTTPPTDRFAIGAALARFGNAIQDGHNFVSDYEGTSVGSFPVLIEDIDGKPVVRRSLAVGVHPGDTITSIAGTPADAWYAKELARTSAASDGYRFNIATRRYLSLKGPIAFGLKHPDGTEETITFQPQPKEDLQALGNAPSARTAGFLADLGAPELYYINLDYDILATDAAFKAALTEAAPAKGLVLDMRGYPGIDHYAAARRLVQSSFSSPHFLVTTLDGPGAASTDESSYPWSPLKNPSFAGPIVLLVGHGTVSAAENFSTMLVDANRVKVMGRRSAATNGNITGVQLPGAFSFSFTGMEVRHADPQESVFHGVGIVPDVESVLTPSAFAAGQDPELLDAITFLMSP